MKTDAQKVMEATFHLGALEYLATYIEDKALSKRVWSHLYALDDILLSNPYSNSIVTIRDTDKMPSEYWDEINALVNDRGL